MTDTSAFGDRYPSLARPDRWGNVTMAPFVRADAVPPLATIQSVNVVPFVGERCLVIGLEDGSVTLPGGTIEAGESLLTAARREMLEEAGAEIHALAPIGYWPCHSEDPAPWRTHLPHPDFLRVVFQGEVTIAGPPSNPADAEQIASVEVLPVPHAIARLRAVGRDELADLYQLAGDLRSGGAASLDLVLIDGPVLAG